MIGRMVLFGASGNLTSRLLMPAIAQLAEAGLLHMHLVAPPPANG
jgi:glucose-6-phosphate 1-dehydrogenase